VEAETPAHEEMISLVERLVTAEMNRSDAERLVREKSDECQRQLEYLPFKTDLKNPGGWLRRAIEGGFPAPREYRVAKAREERERKKREETEKKKSQEAAQEARRRAEAAQVDTEIDRLPIEAPEAFSAFSAYVETRKAAVAVKFGGMGKSIAARMVADLDRPEKRRELFLEWKRTQAEELDSLGEILE
jgi:ABC-type glutathione transport system ATPase component